MPMITIGLMVAAFMGYLVVLLAGVAAHPTRFWVLKQFQQTLDAADSDALRAQLAVELERLMEMLGIDSSNGILGIDRR